MSADDTARRLGLGLGGGGGWEAPSAEALRDAIPGIRVLGPAGRGGMGAVYRAEQTRLGRAVAVKILPPGATADPMARERFEREARVLSELRHPHVLQVHDFGVLADGMCYLVMEWAEGGDLAARLAGGRARPEEAAGWVEQIAAALDAVHARGVVHRDLKPANVLARGDGTLALGDFGLARAEGAGFTTALTLSGVVYGTFDYMAPEQQEGAATVTSAADVYALGVMVYRMLTGRVPRGVFEPVSRVAGVPAAVDEVVMAALAAEPARRPASAGEFARSLRAALAGGGAPAILRPGRRRLAWGGAVAVVLVLLAGIGVWRSGGGGVGEKAKPRAGVADQGARTAKTPLLPAVRPAEDAVAGTWTRRDGELWANDEVALLRVPAELPADFRYEVVVEFTRVAGRHSVGVLLPTAAGVGVFELDAWEQGLGGFQEIDGRDLRSNGEAFPAALRNGVRQQVHLIVDGAKVWVTWRDGWRGEVDLRGRRLSVPAVWGAGEWDGFGLCAWKSPTVFHRVDFRAR